MNHLTTFDLLSLFMHFLMLSFLAVGGAITAVPDMHRYVVTQQHWLTDQQFTASVALAQAAPGPNLLFVAVIGYNVAGMWGALASMTGILLPSTTLALWAVRWGSARRDTRGVRALTAGLAPLTLALMMATGWLLATPARESTASTGLVLLTVLITLKSRLSPVWPMAAGALVGMLGWI